MSDLKSFADYLASLISRCTIVDFTISGPTKVDPFYLIKIAYQGGGESAFTGKSLNETLVHCFESLERMARVSCGHCEAHAARTEDPSRRAHETGGEITLLRIGAVHDISLLEGEDCLLGTTHILGVPHHVTFVRVTRNEQGLQVATRDPVNRLERVLGAYGRAATVKLPWLEGEWVIGIDPYREG